MEPNRNDSPNNGPNRNPGENNRPKNNKWIALLISLAVVLLFSWLFNAVQSSKYTETTYDEFRTAMLADQLAEVEIQYARGRILYMTKEEAAKDRAQQKACYTGLPSGNHMELANELTAMGVKNSQEIVEDNSMIMMILSYAVMIGGLFLVMNLLTKRMRISREIALYKKEHNMGVVQTARYSEILDKRCAQGSLCGMSADFVRRIYEFIHEESVRQQMEIINK